MSLGRLEKKKLDFGWLMYIVASNSILSSYIQFRFLHVKERLTKESLGHSAVAKAVGFVDHLNGRHVQDGRVDFRIDRDRRVV
jgi:hypothetical protein